MQWGRSRESLEQIEEQTGITPQALRSEPELYEDVEWVWRVFGHLNHSRQAGMGREPILISEVLAYCQLFGIDCTEKREALLFLIQELDQEYLKSHVIRRNATSGGGQPQG